MNFPDERANDYEGRRPDQVTFSQLVAGICFGVLIVVGIAGAIIHFSSRIAP